MRLVALTTHTHRRTHTSTLATAWPSLTVQFMYICKTLNTYFLYFVFNIMNPHICSGEEDLLTLYRRS